MPLLLTICGSLRATSTSGAVLDAVTRLAGPAFRVERSDAIGRLPPFNQDVEESALPSEAAAWRASVGRADALLIVSPEYAHGVPGSLKNALDWLVGGSEFVDKPCAVINPSPRSTFAHPQLIETLRTMSGRVIADACITLPKQPRVPDVAAILDDHELAAALREAVNALSDYLASSATGASHA